ncbi:hypothetical protein PTSG_10917 [Salpingoeca rosetta]|uniref:Alpha-1,6-mannosyl-glycoprotein 2-beta-N-acetylglucosaminyltransferase n=1 Tax=Salpingoeca rosetta (strain ATCC 50818 / BSB-021) TaxID=946362 RepID=F2URD8_SALR5|nr:uncharacterized protein PTSG_10917 [Salpingoeca rosetta]EGD80241.1 hypothetical protein PTSG_10917 [Salpingoeca rosetta]|eukprot:XP_004988303.1 hypothetical protein PTSG_10917 [Salpingoeca rosetta]
MVRRNCVLVLVVFVLGVAALTLLTSLFTDSTQQLQPQPADAENPDAPQHQQQQQQLQHQQQQQQAADAPPSQQRDCRWKEEELRDYVVYFSNVTDPGHVHADLRGDSLVPQVRAWLGLAARLLQRADDAYTCDDVRAHIYAAQPLFNAVARLLYASYEPPRLPVASYVFKRIESYRLVLRRLREQEGSGDVHVIVSMDRFNLAYLRMLTEELTFCTWQPIVHELEWETFQQMQRDNMVRVAVPLAFHWWWLQDTLWTRLLKGYDGDVMFLEEDHVLLSNASLQLARAMMRIKNRGESQCDTTSLSMTAVHVFGQMNRFHHVFRDPDAAVVEQPFFSNLAYAFNRSVYEKLRPERKRRMDWDWNINLAFTRAPNGTFARRHLRPVRKRVLNIDMCKPSGGIHELRVSPHLAYEYCGTKQGGAYDLDSLPESHITLPAQVDVYRFEGRYPKWLWVREIVDPQFIIACGDGAAWKPARKVCVHEDTGDVIGCPAQFAFKSEGSEGGDGGEGGGGKADSEGGGGDGGGDEGAVVEEEKVCEPQDERWYPYVGSSMTGKA